MPSPLPPSLWSDTARRVGAVFALLAVAAVGFGVGYLVFDDSGSGQSAGTVSSGRGAGFPQVATRNTTRVGGADAIEDAAAVALATYPSAGGVGAAPAVTIVPADDWQLALAATPLVADPIGTPILLSEESKVPQPTADALDALSPKGLAKANGTQAYVIGGVAAPDDLKQSPVAGADPSDVADAIDGEREKITGEKDPGHILVVSSSEPALAMPAAAWAARSGDPILFADGDNVPKGTTNVIKRHPDTPVYVLGPESAISDKTLKGLDATRVGAQDPVDNAITFARFSDGDFGWNINDPGHGFAIANISRPLDAPAAAPLAATGGSPGPLLLTDESASVPPALESFLSDIQPGFEDDPTRAVFNHTWIIGNTEAMSIGFQSQVDQLTKLAPVTGATTPPGVALPEGGNTDSTTGTGSTSSTTTTDSTTSTGNTDATTTIPDLGGDLPTPTFTPIPDK